MLPIAVPHGHTTVFGYRIGALGYVTDAKLLPPEAIDALRGVKVLVLNALFWKQHPTHMSVPEAIETARAVGAERTYLTHLTHDNFHAKLEEALPQELFPAYDGLDGPASGEMTRGATLASRVAFATFLHLPLYRARRRGRRRLRRIMQAQGIDRRRPCSATTSKCSRGDSRVRNEEALRTAKMDALVRQAVFGEGQAKDHAQWMIWETAQAVGVRPASIHASVRSARPR